MRENPITLRQVDHASTDFAAFESDLQFIIGLLARLPDRTYVNRLVAMAMAGSSALTVAVGLFLAP
jgi:hypothetical protein